MNRLFNRSAFALFLAVAVLAVATSAFAQTSTAQVTFPSEVGLNAADYAILGGGVVGLVKGAVIGVTGFALLLFAILRGPRLVMRLFKTAGA